MRWSEYVRKHLVHWGCWELRSMKVKASPVPSPSKGMGSSLLFAAAILHSCDTICAASIVAFATLAPQFVQVMGFFWSEAHESKPAAVHGLHAPLLLVRGAYQVLVHLCHRRGTLMSNCFLFGSMLCLTPVTGQVPARSHLAAKAGASPTW